MQASGWGSAERGNALLSSSGISKTTKCQPIISRSSLWLTIAYSLPDGKGLETFEVQMPETMIVLDTSQHAASASICLLTFCVLYVTDHYSNDL